MNKFKLRKKFCWDDRGALEGLPLYLIILVVITAIAIVIIVAWLTILQPPNLDYVDWTTDPALEPDGDMKDGTSYDVTFTAHGTNGGKLSGVSITLQGPGYQSKTLKTGDDGSVTFNNVQPSLGPNTTTGEMQITAKYTGAISLTKTYTIPVNK
jgi:hypothetical protein